MKRKHLFLIIGIILNLIQINKYLKFSKTFKKNILFNDSPFFVYDKIGYFIGFNILSILGFLFIYFGYFKNRK